MSTGGTTLSLNSNGKLSVADLPTGTYTLVETATATGYSKASNKTFTVTKDGTTSVTVDNKEDTGNLIITKNLSDSDKTEIISNHEDWETYRELIRFTVQNASTNEYIKFSGNMNIGYTYAGVRSTPALNGLQPDGTLSYKNLPVGVYIIREVANTGWDFESHNMKPSSPISVTITKNGNLKRTIINHVVHAGSLTIHKDINLSDNSDPTTDMYADVGFKVQNKDTKEWVKLNIKNEKTGTYEFASYSANEDEATIIKLGTDSKTANVLNLYEGDYTVYEIGSNNFTAENGELDVEMTSTGSNDIVFVNVEKTGTVEVTKLTTGNFNIADIEFELYGTSDSGREILMSATTNQDGIAVFKKIPIGSYMIREVGETVDTAYLVADEQEVTVIYNNTVEKEFFNIEKTGMIQVLKSTIGNINIDGIEFELYGTSDSGREISITAITDKDGKAFFNNVPIGTYSIREVDETVDLAYLVANEQDVVVVYNETVTTEFFNEEKSGTIQVSKTTTGNLNIADIGFELYGKSDSGRDISIIARTNEDGIATFDGIPVGSYSIREVGETVDTAYLVADEQEVTVIYGETVEKEFFNVEKTGEIQVSKLTTGNLNIADIDFELYGKSDSGRDISIIATTDKNGKAIFSKIPIGSYSIREVGKTVDTAYLVADEQDVTVIYGETVNKEFFNEEKTGEIQVSKSTIGNLNIGNIDFELYGKSDSGRDILITAITDENGKALFNKIPIGSYSIREVGKTVDTAYLVANEQDVTVVYGETVDKSFFNEEKTGMIKVTKQTIGNLNIADIDFELYGTSDSGREILIKATTDKDGIAIFNNIPIGTYMIREVGETVHSAYLVADEQEVTVIYNETLNTQMFNEEKTGTIQVTKDTIGHVNIGDIDFELYGVSESGRDILITSTTNADGKAIFNAIPIGSYMIREVGETVDFAYLVADEQDVTVTFAETSEKEFFNDIKTGSIEITKTDVSTGELIPNCEIEILDADMNVIISDKTDENGIVKFTLPVGKYYYRECKAPKGYLIDTTPYEFEILEHGKIIKAKMTNEKIPDDDVPQTGIKEVFPVLLISMLGVGCWVTTLKHKRKSNK